MSKPVKQHLIDPEICIRCYTCEAACSVNAIEHDGVNVVVDVTKCNFCMDCIAPCPTGSIDNWRVVERALFAGRPIRLAGIAGAARLRRRGLGGRRRDRGDRRRRRPPARRGSRRRGRQGEGAALGEQADDQSLHAGQAGRGDGARQLPPDRRGRRQRRAPHHSRFWRPALSGARRAEPRRHAARRRRRGQAASAAPLFRFEPARRRAAQFQQSLADGEARAARRLLELRLRSEEGRQGARRRPVRRDLPDAERSEGAAADDLHRHGFGAVPRLHHAPPAQRRGRVGEHDAGVRRPHAEFAALFRPAEQSAGHGC